MSALPVDWREQVWHVYWNGGHVLGPVDYLTASSKHTDGPNDSRIVRAPASCECGMTDPEMPCIDCRFREVPA